MLPHRVNRSVMWACRVSPKHHDRTTLTDKPRNNTARPHNNPAHT